jgi:hypothetical protein
MSLILRRCLHNFTNNVKITKKIKKSDNLYQEIFLYELNYWFDSVGKFNKNKDIKDNNDNDKKENFDHSKKKK